MSIDKLRSKIHDMVDKIEDERTLNILMEDAALYITTKNISDNEDLNAEQWARIELAQSQIKNGQYKTYDEVKKHFSQWFTK